MNTTTNKARNTLSRAHAMDLYFFLQRCKETFAKSQVTYPTASRLAGEELPFPVTAANIEYLVSKRPELRWMKEKEKPKQREHLDCEALFELVRGLEARVAELEIHIKQAQLPFQPLPQTAPTLTFGGRR